MQKTGKQGFVKRAYNRTRGLISQSTLVCAIENTTACNLKCKFCPHPNLNLKVEFISSDIWNLAIDQIAELYEHGGYEVIRISYGGLGEPLIHPQFLAHLRFLKSKLPDARVQLDTNGVILDPSKADAIIDERLVETLSVSLNAPTKELYSELMLADKFDDVLRNIRYFVEKRNASKSDIKVSVCVKDTDDCRADNAAMTEKFGAILSGKDTFCVNDILNWGGQIDVNTLSSSTTLKPIDFPCYGLMRISNVVIDLHGNVFPCCCSIADRENSNLMLGNIQQKPLTDIWMNEKHKGLMKAMMRGQITRLTPCKDCTMYSDDEYYQFFSNPLPFGPRYF